VNAGRLAGSVIFTCDEFGESHSANVAVIEAMERGLGGGGIPSAPRSRCRLAGLSPGLTDLYIHPCVDSAELRALQPARADERIEQYNLLVHNAGFTEALSRSGVRVITWRSVRERQCGRSAAE